MEIDNEIFILNLPVAGPVFVCRIVWIPVKTPTTTVQIAILSSGVTAIDLK